MLVVIGSAAAAPGCRSQLVEAARRVVAATRQDEGCLSYGFSTDIDDPDVLVGVEIWRDQAALDAHMEHDHTVEFLAEIEGLFAGGPSMTFLSAQPLATEGTS